MGAFNGETMKSLVLFGTVPWLSDLAHISRVRTKSMKVRGADAMCHIYSRAGVRKVKGKAKRLQTSAAYTYTFGLVTSMLHRTHSANDVLEFLASP